MSEVFLVEEEVNVVCIRTRNELPTVIPKVWWLSRHPLTDEQKRIICRLDGQVDVYQVASFWARNSDEFVELLRKYSSDGIVYVVGPVPWLAAAARAGLSFRTFNCFIDSIGNIKFKCVYEYSGGFRYNILGAHQLR